MDSAMVHPIFFSGFNIFLLYYTDVFGLSPAVGTMFLVTKIVDTVTDPMMGIIGDQTTRWGKFALSAVDHPVCLCGYLMFAN